MSLDVQPGAPSAHVPPLLLCKEDLQIHGVTRDHGWWVVMLRYLLLPSTFQNLYLFSSPPILSLSLPLSSSQSVINHSPRRHFGAPVSSKKSKKKTKILFKISFQNALTYPKKEVQGTKRRVCAHQSRVVQDGSLPNLGNIARIDCPCCRERDNKLKYSKIQEIIIFISKFSTNWINHKKYTKILQPMCHQYYPLLIGFLHGLHHPLQLREIRIWWRREKREILKENINWKYTSGRKNFENKLNVNVRAGIMWGPLSSNFSGGSLQSDRQFRFLGMHEPIHTNTHTHTHTP